MWWNNYKDTTILGTYTCFANACDIICGRKKPPNGGFSRKHGGRA